MAVGGATGTRCAGWSALSGFSHYGLRCPFIGGVKADMSVDMPLLPKMALLGHGAVSELSPLSGVKQKLDFGAVRAAFDPLRKSRSRTKMGRSTVAPSMRSGRQSGGRGPYRFDFGQPAESRWKGYPAD
jgi:hypothetical protein